MKILKQIYVLLGTVKKDLIYLLIIGLLLAGLSLSIKQCSDTRFQYENNIAALNDTIHYYQNENDNLVATKLAFESDINTLKLLNDTLYNQIKYLKAKGKVTNATSFSGVIDNPKKDTTYIVVHDTITKGFTKNFSFNDKYRLLEGNIYYNNDNAGINIEKDQILFDYTVALDDDNNIMICSTNPYVKYNEISGFTLPKKHEKHWSLNAFGSYMICYKDPSTFIDMGISLDYSLNRFRFGPVVYYDHNTFEHRRGFCAGARLNVKLLEW